MSIRPRRSVLYMSGANSRSLEKAQNLKVDSLIFDLEDAVAPEQKVVAREKVSNALDSFDYSHREKVIRINTIDSVWGKADLAAALSSKVDAILLPKVESADTVKEVGAMMDQADPKRRIALWAMIETPLGVLNVQSIATSSPRLDCLVMGTSDLIKDLHARSTQDRGPILVSLHLCLLAARAHGLSILDGVHVDLKDLPGLKAVAMQGRNMGFDGKTVIHPNQIDIVNEVFSPSPVEVEQARLIVRAWQEALDEGKGVCVVNGKLVEKLHVDEANRILSLTRAIAGQQDY
ncbi:CoA ester lyase [Hahella sp. CCB-MM4]|uniref:HpcH/HpaI aldolase/citrate lyase family protein n=1 Tax=Hahella sp. (strain CCB-MM4) TaxID=1926491 RepID=UPI000B9C2CF3|nr:CoA ester lyase [Hahella sp. CCB-MM4]OZG71930.1 CoA ester lyase [Hahella sp. CCB-MM4]